MSSTHSRNASAETSATSATGGSYSMIAEHVLQYPGSYEIPLRTMHTLNCNPRAQPLPSSSLSRAASPTLGSTSPLPWNNAESSVMSFTSQLMTHIDSLPSQPSSLPPTFIVSFITRCFCPCLAMVDFPQALTALDYLRDLEKRRCREYVAALNRVGIQVDTFNQDVDVVAARFPGIALWARNMHEKNKKAEKYWGALYLGLRRWILINELSLQPFNMLNCMGMLNTLHPPASPSGKFPLSTPLLSLQTLKEEREMFFQYIKLVKEHGPGVLTPVIEFGKNPGDENGWDNVQRTVDKYTRVAKNMIDDCMATTGTDSFTDVDDARKGKKTDSGVSFGSDQRPSTANGVEDKPLPPPPSELKPPSKGFSKIERIAREFKRMRVKTRVDVEEIVKIDKSPSINPATPTEADGESKAKKTMKKARSFANLAHLRSANNSSTSLMSRKASDAAQFDPEEMKRARMHYEAGTTAKGSKNLL